MIFTLKIYRQDGSLLRTVDGLMRRQANRLASLYQSWGFGTVVILRELTQEKPEPGSIR